MKPLVVTRFGDDIWGTKIFDAGEGRIPQRREQPRGDKDRDVVRLAADENGGLLAKQLARQACEVE